LAWGDPVAVAGVVRLLAESCLVPFLEEHLRNESLLDIERHAPLYTTLFQVIEAPSIFFYK
jgi:hypothetical protein